MNTIPLETLEAYGDNGKPKACIENYTDGANQVLQQVELLGINMSKVTQQFEEEGVEKFTHSFDELIERRSVKCWGNPIQVNLTGDATGVIGIFMSWKIKFCFVIS